MISDFNESDKQLFRNIEALGAGDEKEVSARTTVEPEKIGNGVPPAANSKTLSPAPGGEIKEEQWTNNTPRDVEQKIVSPPEISRNGSQPTDPNPPLIVDDIYVPKNIGDYQPLVFADPVDLLFYIDDNISSGRLKLHDWPMEILIMLAQPYSFDERLRFLLTAANGSGKDAYILAAFAVWQLVTKVRSRFIGTSKSAHQ